MRRIVYCTSTKITYLLTADCLMAEIRKEMIQDGKDDSLDRLRESSERGAR